MKKTLAKGGKTEKNMKKQSILNLVNSILLLCTLLFSVISFAWYTNSTNIAPPLSFTAQDVDSLEGLVMIKFDDIRSANDKVIKPAQTGDDKKTLDHLGAERFPETVPDTLNFADVTFEMGVIDDLGYLRDTNCVYYCLPVSVQYDEVVINLAYTSTNSHLDQVTVLEDGESKNVNLHFNLREDDTTTTTVGDTKLLTTYTLGSETRDFHLDAASYEFNDTTQNNKNAYVMYDCALSTTAPTAITRDQMSALFDGTTDTSKKSGTMVSPDGYNPEDAGAENATISTTGMTITANQYYVYVRVYPNLDNYEKLAELMLDHMPFYMAFGLRLYVGLPVKN